MPEQPSTYKAVFAATLKEATQTILGLPKPTLATLEKALAAITPASTKTTPPPQTMASTSPQLATKEPVSQLPSTVTQTAQPPVPSIPKDVAGIPPLRQLTLNVITRNFPDGLEEDIIDQFLGIKDILEADAAQARDIYTTFFEGNRPIMKFALPGLENNFYKYYRSTARATISYYLRATIYKNYIADNSYGGFRIACAYGLTHEVKRQWDMLAHDPQARKAMLTAASESFVSGFILAMERGHFDIVQWLWAKDIELGHEQVLSKSLKKCIDRGFPIASKRGQTSVLRWLWETSDEDTKSVLINDSKFILAFRNAVENGHLETMQYLWSLVNPYQFLSAQLASHVSIKLADEQTRRTFQQITEYIEESVGMTTEHSEASLKAATEQAYATREQAADIKAKWRFTAKLFSRGMLSATIEYSAANGRIDCLEWLLTTTASIGLKWDFLRELRWEHLKLASDNKHGDTVTWLWNQFSVDARKVALAILDYDRPGVATRYGLWK